MNIVEFKKKKMSNTLKLCNYCGDCSAREIWETECQEADYLTADGNYHAHPENPCDNCPSRLRQRIAELEWKNKQLKVVLEMCCNNMDRCKGSMVTCSNCPINIVLKKARG